MDQLNTLQAKWGINKLHFKDLNLYNICRNKAYVLNENDFPIMVSLYHIMKVKDVLFILHDNLNNLYKHGNTFMTISHLKTGRPLFHFEMNKDESILSIEQRVFEYIEDSISRLSERYFMDKIKNNRGINLKYNINGH